MIFGQQGLLKVEYLGEVNGQWKGTETCRQYPFGRGKRLGWVDRRDVPGLLKARGLEGETLFREAG